MKREDYISWQEYFVALASLAAQRSKDPNTQVGACIVDKDNRVVSIGYNGWPIGINDDDLPWGRDGEQNDTKYPYVVHSEMNAIANTHGADIKGSTIYVTLFPCNKCTQLIIQSGIKKIIYIEDKYHDLDDYVAARKMLDLAKVEYEQYQTTGREIKIQV